MKTDRIAHLILISSFSIGMACAQTESISTVTIEIDGPDKVADIPSETYTVCSIHSHASHPGLNAAHLEIGDFVQVQRQGKLAHVVLAKSNPYRQVELTMSGDSQMVIATKTFPHFNIPSDKVQQSEHLVAVTYVPAEDVAAYPEGCKKNDQKTDLLQITFCWRPSPNAPDWQCKPPGGDYGHVHAQL